MAGVANTGPRPSLTTHSHIHSLSLLLVAMMRSKKLQATIYSHAHSLILSISNPLSTVPAILSAHSDSVTYDEIIATPVIEICALYADSVRESL